MKGHLELHSGVLVGTKVLHAQDIQLHGLQTSTAFSIIKPQRPNPSIGHRSLVEEETPFAHIQLIFLDGGVLHTKLRSFGFLA